jgi:tetratricopeptide (TPR) repeat protein
LAKAIAARPPAKGGRDTMELGLRFLAATLTGDAAARQRETTKLQTKAKNADLQSAYLYRNYLEQLSRALLEMSDDPEAILRSLERQLDTGRQTGIQYIQVPNLVSQVGPEKAEAFLRKALVSAGAQLSFNEADETSKLAQKLALELVDQLKSPPWDLVNSLDSIKLYEALDKRFGAETNKPAALPGIPDIDLPVEGFGLNQKAQAQTFYLLGLIAADRSQDAIAQAKKLGGLNRIYVAENAFKEMERAGYTAALDNFFFQLLSQDPTLGFWDQYVPLAAQPGQTARMLTLARAAAARDDLSDAKKWAIRQVLFRALLAADQVEEGVQEIRRLAALEAPTQRDSSSDTKGQLGVMLAQIGVLLEKPDWTGEGVALAKSWLAPVDGRPSFAQGSGQVISSLCHILLKQNRGPEAEALLADALAHATRKDRSDPQFDSEGNDEARQILTELASLYQQAGRQNDVLTLLSQSPWWGAKDLGDLFQSEFGENEVSLMWLHTGASPKPIPYLAADALIATGQSAQAGKIVDELLQRYPGLDRAFELLLALKGTNAIPRLDQLFAQDQFEERPLIWKAHLLRQQNQLAEAEKTIRQAIAIDPSDGEEGRGDRMRAYSELAEIRDAQGEKKDADNYREIVKAIRISEDADQFYAAGLLQRAIAMYQQGLTHFTDAYCIQSRLAIQMSALGLNQEAEEHYRLAYQLMPGSFGRVESHCFGCERVFEGERPQNIAEQVFTKLAIEQPNKPQVHYLLGYLREDEERYNEASTNYLEAVRLDPSYLNAWGRLAGLSQRILMPPAQRDAIVFNILRLDPLQRHQTPNFQRVSDLPALWNVVEAATRHRPVPVKVLFPLTASKAALEKKEATATANSNRMIWRSNQFTEDNALSPGRAIAQTPYVQLAGQMILSPNNPFE